eukprot:761321-Hanusia_phi.AAC.2
MAVQGVRKREVDAAMNAKKTSMKSRFTMAVMLLLSMLSMPMSCDAFFQGKTKRLVTEETAGDAVGLPVEAG